VRLPRETAERLKVRNQRDLSSQELDDTVVQLVSQTRDAVQALIATWDSADHYSLRQPWLAIDVMSPSRNQLIPSDVRKLLPAVTPSVVLCVPVAARSSRRPSPCALQLHPRLEAVVAWRQQLPLGLIQLCRTSQLHHLARATTPGGRPDA
jgi:hypothetical protein